MFIAGLYAASNDAGRRHIRGGIWMITTILATLLVAYLGQFGPMKPPLLRNPIDLVVMIAIGIASFFWSVRPAVRPRRWRRSSLLEQHNYAAAVKTGLDLTGYPAGPARKPFALLAGDARAELAGLLRAAGVEVAD